MLLTINWEP